MSTNEAQYHSILGIRTALVDVGAGEPVVLVHGMAVTHDCWMYTIDFLLERGYRVIAPDLPGHGHSGDSPRHATLSTYVAWLDSLLNALGLESCTLVGHSLGAAICLAYTLAHPEKVNRLMLTNALLASTRVPLGGGLRAVLRLPHLVAGLATGRLDPHYFRYFRRRNVYDPWGPAQVPLQRSITVNKKRGLGVYRAGLSVLWHDFLPPRRRKAFVRALSSIRADTLIVWGREDRLIPVQQAYDAARSLRDARVVVYELCSHCPAIEVPSQFNATLLAFLRERKDYGNPAR